MAFIFDSGAIFGVSKQFVTPTPVKIGSLQNVQTSFDFDLTYSPLQTQARIGAAVNGLNLKFTARAAQMNGLMLNQLFFGKSLSTGSQALSRDQQATVPNAATGTVTVTPTVPTGGTWSQDLGVQDDSSGEPMELVASNPGAGQYSVSAGVYTFSAAERSKVKVFNYLYTLTTGNKILLTNSFKQLAPYFQVVLSTLYNGQQVTWNLPRCTSKQLQLATTVTNFSLVQFGFEAMADLTPPLGNIGTFSFS